MRALKSSLKMRRAEELLLRIEARGARDYVAFDQDVDFRIRLRNVSRELVVLGAPTASGAGSSPSAMTLEIRRRDRDVHGRELRRTWNRTVYLLRPGGRDIRIPPGGVHEVPVRIPAADVGGPISGLRILEVSGVLRPTDLRKGGEARSVRLRIRRGRVVALPRNFEPLAADPLGAMRQATSTGAPVHLLIAAEFVSSAQRGTAVEILAATLATGPPALRGAAVGALALLRERAVGQLLRPLVEPLIAALEHRPPGAQGLMEGLSTLTDVHLAPDPRLWSEWWRREAGRRTLVKARRDGRDAASLVP